MLLLSCAVCDTEGRFVFIGMFQGEYTVSISFVGFEEHRQNLLVGELSFSASDIFNSFGIRQEIVGEGFTATYENYYENQVFRIGLKYKF